MIASILERDELREVIVDLRNKTGASDRWMTQIFKIALILKSQDLDSIEFLTNSKTVKCF